MRGALALAVGCSAGDSGVPTPATEPPDAPACPEFGAPVSLGVAPTPPAIEVSGVAVGEGRIWAHNDSGEPAEVFALGMDGAHLGTWSLAGVDAIDFEDLARGPGPDGQPWLYVGDIGDNAGVRGTLQVYRFREPVGAPGPIDAERIEIRYPDGPRDAETLLVDPEDGALYVVTKVADGRSDLFQLLVPAPGLHTLVRVHTFAFGEEPLGQATLVTGGDAGPRGLVLRTYLERAFVWPKLDGERLTEIVDREPCEVELAPEPQGEAVAWGPEGLLTVSEGEAPDVNLVPWAAP